jgi:hypothetical protein
MKHQIQWLALVLAFAVGVAGSLGCATMLASEAVKSDDASFYYTPVLSDEIVAIGRPDAKLAKELEQPDAVAFVGLKKTYLLYKGGAELERIAQLKLDGRRMDIDSVRSNRLYLKDKQVWGDLTLTYGGGFPVSADDQAELEKGGFTVLKGARNNQYQKKVSIEGVIYPAIKLSDEQMSKLTTRRTFSLYNSKDAKPPVLNKILKAPLIAVGVATDIVLAPVYLGVGVIVLVGVAASGH